MPDDDSPSEPWVVPIEDHLDLHAYRPRDIPEVVADYLDAAAARVTDAWSRV